MALPPCLRCCCSFLALLCLSTSCCKSDEVPADPVPEIATRSLQCFEDGQIYSCCEEAYRLNPVGIINVPMGMVDYYCNGECLVETENVLNCVASMLDDFKFYNGASVEDARYALRRGCSHTFKRGKKFPSVIIVGDFNDLEPQVGDYPDIYGGGGNKLTVPMRALTLVGGALLLLGY